MSTVAQFPQPAEPHVEYRLECSECNAKWLCDTENGARSNAWAHRAKHDHRMRLTEVSERELRLER